MDTNPILREPKNILYYALLWLFIAGLYILQLVFEYNLDFTYSAAESLIFTFFIACFCLIIWYPVKFNNFDTAEKSKVVLSHVLSAIILSTAWIIIGYFIITQLPINPQKYTMFLNNSLVWKFLFGVIFYFGFAAFYYLFIYYSRYQEKLLYESKLKASVTEAELKSLKFQINPHFIFNSLNSITSLTMFDPEKAHEMTIKLSNFLRYTLAKNDRQKTKLSEEIHNVRLYLDIEKIRFGDKFDLVESVDEKTLGIEVPSMILQPLFENAIKYGVFESIEKVNIHLKVTTNKEYLRISVENSYETKTRKKKGEGIGLTNIKNRLELFYNQDNLLEINDNNNIFKVTIFIPLENDAE